MGIRLKSVFFVCVIIMGILATSTGCAAPQDNEQDEADNAVTTAAVTEPAETWADETFIPFENSTICATEEPVNRIRGDARVVVSRLEMLALGLDLPYDAEFFKDHALVVVQFEGAGGEEAREVTHLVVRDGLIRPVVTIDSQEDLSANFEYTLLTVEIERTNKKMEFGEVLVINNFNPSWGSIYRDRFEYAGD